MKLYAINDNKQTIVTFTFASNCEPRTQNTDQEIAKINIIGNMILNK